MRILAVAILAAACGGPAAAIPTGDQTQSNCSATISGAVSVSSIKCFPAAGFDSSGHVGINFLVDGYTIAAVVDFPGQPASGTYTRSNTGADSAMEVVESGSHRAWFASAGGSAPEQGSYSLTLTGLSAQGKDPGGPGVVWLIVHGTLTATMPADPDTSATGSVTLTASF